jgi:hypothetical protein
MLNFVFQGLWILISSSFLATFKLTVAVEYFFKI